MFSKWKKHILGWSWLASVFLLTLLLCCTAQIVNAATWSSVNAVDSKPVLYGVGYGNGQFIAVGPSGSIFNSSDAANWLALSAPSDDFTAAAYGGGVWIVSGTSSMYRSDNGGNTWAKEDLPPQAASFASLSYGNRKFITVGGGGIFTSSDYGETWEQKYTENSTETPQFGLNGTCYGNGTYVVVGGSDAEVSTVLTSSDAVNWTKRSIDLSTSNSLLNCAAYGNGIFVAGGYSGKILYSTDNGVNWQAGTTGTNNTIWSITYVNGNFYAVGDGGIVLFSPDGDTWTPETTTATDSLFGVASGNGKVAVVGDVGVTLYADVPASNDATLKASSTIKGQTITNLGTPKSTLGSETAGAATITAAEASDITEATTFVTLFNNNDAGATVKVVKYAPGDDTSNFAGDNDYTNAALTNGDFFIIKVTAADTTTVNYYKIVVTVTSSDATLKATSTVKGEIVTSLGMPNGTLGSETAGAVTLTAAEAADTSNTGSFVTLFDKSDAGATVSKVVKYSATEATTNFETGDVDYANEEISNGDFFIIKVTAADNSVEYYRVTVTVLASSEKAITAFSLAAQTGAATIDAVNHTVAITVANGTSITNLVPTFTLSGGATAKVGTTDQISGTTANDFTAPVTYAVQAADNSSQNWTVTVTVAASSAKDITAFSLAAQTGAATIDAVNHTVAITVANGTSVTNLVPTFTLSGGATAKVGTTDQISGTTSNDFTAPVTYAVQAADNSSQNWTVTVTVAASSAKDITAFSLAAQTGAATIDAGNHTIAITVASGTSVTNLVPTFTLSSGATAKVGTTDQVSGTTANDFTAPVTYAVQAADNSSQNWTVTVTVAASSAKDITAFSLVAQTGAATIDAGNHTVAITVTNGTSVTNLVPTFTLSGGATAKVGTTDQISGTTANDFTAPVTYAVQAADNSSQNWTVTVTVAASSAKDITAFSLAAQTGAATIDAGNHTIAITVASGTSVTNLVPTFTLSGGATAKVGTTDQISGTTANDFTAPVTYAVQAADNSSQNWTVTVTVAASSAKDITAFSLAAQTGAATIDAGNHTIAITVASGTSVTNLVPTFTLSSGATAKVGTTDQVSGTTANDFTVPVIYVVQAADNSSQNWTVTVTVTVTYTLTYNAGPNGSITGTTLQTVNSGTSGSSVTAVANAGYHFVNWSDNVTTATRTDSDVTGNINVTANFAADSPSGGGGSNPPPTPPTTVTGIIVDGTTGTKVSDIIATVTTDNNGNSTVSMNAAQTVELRQPNGNTSPLTDVSKLTITTAAGSPVPVAADGTIQVANLAKGTDNNFSISYDLGNGQKITLGTMNIRVDSNGNVTLTTTLIDPYGIITDEATGEVIDGVNVTLYYADTDRNKAAGKTPDTVVQLPGIDDFKPNNNANPQVSDVNGAYGFMVFPTSDYYIVADKDGYDQYKSPTISVEQDIVKWDFEMQPSAAVSATINPTSTTFDLNTSNTSVGHYTDIPITITFNGKTLLSIVNGSTSLTNDIDYTVTGDVCSISKTYLAKQSVGITTLTFNFNAGSPQSLVIAVSNSAPQNQTYTVTYDGNGNSGGSVPADSNNYAQGATVTVLGNIGGLVKSEYTFTGWNTAANGSGTSYAAGATLKIGTANVTLYVQWTTAPPSYSGGGGGGPYTPSPVSATVNGNVIDGTTGAKISNLTATVINDSNGKNTITLNAAQILILKQPDGSTSPLDDISKVTIIAAADAPATISDAGTIQVPNLAKGTDNSFNFAYDLGDGQKISIGTMEIKVSADGVVTLTTALINPYGIITDVATEKVLEGVNVTLYYADTARNKAAGKTPNTVAPLPSIAGFKPNDNQDPQMSDAKGVYGFIVSPAADYYIVAIKAGYKQYTSPTILGEQEFVDWDFKMNQTTVEVTRLAGLTRVDTALAIAKASYPGKVANVILATADNYPDALAGSVLAYKVKAPILLVGSSDADQEKVLDYLKSNLDPVGKIYILGGTAAVSSTVEKKVAAEWPNIIRLGGADRYDTSVKIADQLEVKPGTSIVLVSGENYSDALSISSIAAEIQSPILLVQKDGISDTVRQKIDAIKPTKVYIIGLQGVIGTDVENEVAQLTGLAQTNIVRIGGTDRYATSLAVAQYFNLSGQNICVATGDNFPDALAGSIYAANHNAPIILADGTLSDQVIDYLKTRKVTGVTLFGGEAVINKDIEQQFEQ